MKQADMNVMADTMVPKLPRGGMPPPPPPPGYIAPRTYLPPPPTAPGVVLTPIQPAGVRWKWRHLWLFGVLAFGLPQGLAEAFAPRGRVSEFLDGALYFQIVGYLLAVLLAVHMVRKLQNGDWATLGIRWDGNERREIASGALFGLLCLGVWLPISLILSGGKLEMDELMRLLVGSTNGLGLVLGAIVVVVGAPIIEEIYYRGILYEKLARRNVWLALGVTTILFTLAHGALFIPAIMLLGFGLAWQRRTKPLWHTMGAHAAWNLTVLVMGLFLILGGWEFTPSDGAYTIRLPKSWERAEIPPGVVDPAFFDLGVTTPSGSLLSIMRMPVVGGSAQKTVESLMTELEKGELKGAPHFPPEPHDHLFDKGAESLRVVYAVEDQGMRIGVNFFVLVKPGDPNALVMNFICPEISCTDDGTKFDEALHGLRFGP